MKLIDSKHIMRTFLFLLAGLSLTTSCKDEITTWDPYANWQNRNAEWFRQVSDTARTAIARAKEQYGDDWASHCEWRRFKTIQKNPNVQSGNLADTICVKIIQSGEHAADEHFMPNANDSVRLSYRAWLMPTQYDPGDGQLRTEQRVFSQTYYGAFSTTTAAPILMAVASTVEGFSTALQQMTEGDDWLIYIPQEQAYGSKASDAVPAYSTLLYRVYIQGIYANGSGVPDLK
ncbi:MAG: FKBP-type peptidyl-prolyl cis-trans isomerase [Bacteroidales bacterium]|nr:FKBP-type peptidyl-prolyl cis-trans isomerase [Candidatus Physcousia equi]